jgi:hypothetical protein
MTKRTVVRSMFPALVLGALFLGTAGDALAAHRTGGGGQRSAPHGTAMRPAAPARGGGVVHGGVAVRPGSPPVSVHGHAAYGYHGGHVHGHVGWYGGAYWPYYAYAWPYYYYRPYYAYPYYYGYGYGYGPPPANGYPPATGYPPTYDYDDSGAGGGSGAPAYGPPAQVETDVAPGKATVRLDGEDVGQAKDYDGRWDQLSVEPGQHTLEFEAEGFKTLRLDINIRPGSHYRMGYDLSEGEGPDPRSKIARTQAAPQSNPYQAPQRSVPQAYNPPRPPEPQEYRSPYRPAPPPVAAPQVYEDAPSSSPNVFDETPSDAPGAAEDLPHAAKGGTQSGFLKMQASPGDATVYLDGSFFGRADEISGMHGAIPVATGEHRIEVVHPGYATRAVRVKVEAGKSAEVKIDLKQEADL